MSKHSRVTIQPNLLTWARERAGLSLDSLANKFPKIAEWEAGRLQPTLKQLERFAGAVHVPIGYLFLPEPPRESLPIPDFRTVSDLSITRLNVNLLDTIYLCQERQAWYRDYARLQRFTPMDFIGGAKLSDAPTEAAKAISTRLNLSMDERSRLPNWAETLRELMAKTEELGVLVMASSIVGGNTHRKLEVSEFRGFALVDSLAPLIFINAADSKAAQMFTLAHELAHLWLDESGVSDLPGLPASGRPQTGTEAGKASDLLGRQTEQEVERWCNAVAAELLMPMQATREAYRRNTPLTDEIQRLAKRFKVSTLVVLRRLFDAGFLDATTLWRNYRQESERIANLDRGGSSGGGNFYRTLKARNGERFARAVIASTLEGQTLFQDAFRMLRVKKSATFYRAAQELGVIG